MHLASGTHCIITRAVSRILDRSRYCPFSVKVEKLFVSMVVSTHARERRSRVTPSIAPKRPSSSSSLLP